MDIVYYIITYEIHIHDFLEFETYITWIHPNAFGITTIPFASKRCATFYLIFLTMEPLGN
jgi:hypothetical protein